MHNRAICALSERIGRVCLREVDKICIFGAPEPLLSTGNYAWDLYKLPVYHKPVYPK
jgi:hypothetical protein